MNTADIEQEVPFTMGAETVVDLPSGLLGFEQFKRYLLTPASEPFYWLRAENEPSLSFLVACPFRVAEDYAPDIPTEEARSLGIECPDDVVLLNIVTLRGKGRATINLKGPIVMNRFSRMARQVIISNAAEYSLQHPLMSGETTVVC